MMTRDERELTLLAEQSVAPRDAASTRVEPLTDDERARAAAVGRRLRGEFAALVAVLPAHERTSAGLERTLGTTKAVGHRLLTALNTTDDLDILTRIPGVEGLRLIASAAKRKFTQPRGQTKSIIAGAESALAEFQDLIRRTGGSHAKLVARLRTHAPGPARATEHADTPPGRRETSRRAMFETVQALCGRAVEARAGLSIIRPRPEAPDEAEYVHARAFLGYRAVPGALPLVLSSWVTNTDETRKMDVDYRDLRNEPIEGRENTGLLAPFCTDPLPVVASRDTTGRLVQIVDRTGIEAETPMDAVMAYRLPSVGPIPSRLDPPIFLEAVNVGSPCKHLLADFYFHRSLMPGCTPGLNLYLGRGTGGCDLIDRWHEHLHGGPVLGLLGRGVANAHSPIWSRQAELTRHVFSEIGWDPQEFVGFRCEERWPLWQCDYVMSLDYRRTV